MPSGPWKFVERSILVVGLLIAAATLYFTAGAYFRWNEISIPTPATPAVGAYMIAPSWVFILGAIGVLLLITGWIMIVMRRLPKGYVEIPPINMDQNLRQISNRRYRNETVDMDGIEFIDCTMENVNLRYNGKALTRLTRVIIPQTAPFNISSHHPIVKQTLLFITALMQGGHKIDYIEDRPDDVLTPR